MSGLLSRGRPTYQSETFGDRDGSLAVDGNYDNSKPDNCSTANYNSAAYYFPYNGIRILLYDNLWWMVDLGDTYAVFHVVLYNAGFLPGKTISKICLHVNIADILIAQMYLFFFRSRRFKVQMCYVHFDYSRSLTKQ